MSHIYPASNRPEPRHYTKPIDVSGHACIANISVTRNGHFIVKAGMPDGSLHTVGNKGFPKESQAVSAAKRAAQRIIDINPQMMRSE